MVNDQKKTIHHSISQSPENVEESWSSTPPSGPRRVVQRSIANSITKKRSAAAPAAANDEGSDKEDEARLKRLRNLHGRPNQYHLKLVMMRSQLGIFFIHWSRWTSAQTSPRQHQLGPKMIIKPKRDLRNSPWPPPLEDNDHHSPALRWSLLLHIMEFRKQGLEVGEPIYFNFD